MNDRFLEDLKDRVDIVDLIRKYAELKKSGKNYMCRSPFRNERTPSFCVSPDKQFWYDFGNSEGGDAISFLEKIENVSFREAVEMLADVAGVEIPESFSHKSGPSKEKKKDLYDLHAEAQKYLEKNLKSTETAREYLHKRGITDEIAARWHLGYAGNAAQGLTKTLLESGFNESQIQDSGVAFEREFGDKSMRDRFRQRLMIPICEPREGKIIAFSGRDLSGKDGTAKYINSPENPVYHKSSTLFGLDRARKIIQEKDKVILVEGNFDVITMHEQGFPETVATCGTSLTEEHLRQVKRLTKNVHLAFDSDLAGKKATLRGVEMTLKLGLNPSIIEIVGGKDVDELAQNSPDELKTLVEKAPSALAFLFQKFSEKFINDTIEGEKKFLDHFFFFLKCIDRPIEIDDFLSKISNRLKRSKSVIEEEFKKYCTRTHKPPRIKREREAATVTFSREQAFVGFVLAFWDSLKEQVTQEHLLLLPEDLRNLLSQKMTNQPFTTEENQLVLSWQLRIENLYGDHVSSEVALRDFQNFLEPLWKADEKMKRLEEARNLNF